MKAHAAGRALDRGGGGELAGQHRVRRLVDQRVVDDMSAGRVDDAFVPAGAQRPHGDRHLVDLVAARTEARLRDRDGHDRIGRLQGDQIEYPEVVHLTQLGAEPALCGHPGREGVLGQRADIAGPDRTG